jgi:hypothetical protein
VTLVLVAVVDGDGLMLAPPLARAMVPPITTATNAAKIALPNNFISSSFVEPTCRERR